MITFEEYKKQFEIFSKIDSPEKLAICESQYNYAISDRQYYEFRYGEIFNPREPS
jgi:hypothetical protein